MLLIAGCSAPPGTPLGVPASRPATGPLRVDSANPRYFEDPEGRLVLLAGSHTWSDLQDYGFTDPPAPFDYEGFLDSLVANGHNFLRLWRWEQATWQTESTRDFWFSPQPYRRPGPGLALDGKPRFDLTEFDQSYFDRMRSRVEEAGRRGIYVAVMLFNGWSIETKDHALADPWRGHPFNRANNVNGIDGDPDSSGNGLATHTLRIPSVTVLQERYVDKVIETVGDLDNVLYEISNESRQGSAEWQYHVVGYVKEREARHAKRHPVGMAVEFPGGDNRILFEGPADWVSPRGDFSHPPVADGRKVVLWDTDHLCGLCGNGDAVWRAFLRGANPVFMDPFDSTARSMDVKLGPEYAAQGPPWAGIRRSLGQVRAVAARLRLRAMAPKPALASTRYCLAAVGPGPHEYLAYQPEGGRFRVDLRDTHDSLSVEWFSPGRGDVIEAGPVRGGAWRTLSPPFRHSAVVHLYAPRR